MKYLIQGAFLLLFVQCQSHHHISATKEISHQDSAPSAATLENTYWKLTELMGQPVSMDTQHTHEPYMILQKGDSTVKGNGGCNGFGGRFEWSVPNKIKISRIMSTMMACEKIQQENEFFKLLQTADNYYLTGDTLILNRARMAPLARFKAVYLK